MIWDGQQDQCLLSILKLVNDKSSVSQLLDAHIEELNEHLIALADKEMSVTKDDIIVLSNPILNEKIIEQLMRKGYPRLEILG